MTEQPQMNLIKMGERLLRVRQEQKLSQIEFVGPLGISATALKTYENGAREIPSSVLFKINESYGTNPLWLLGYDNVETKFSGLNRPLNFDLLVAVGTRVEQAIASTNDEYPLEKKWKIIAYLYEISLGEGNLKDHLLSIVLDVGGL